MIATMHATAQFFRVARHGKYFKVIVLQLLRTYLATGQIEAKPLRGDRKTIFEATKTHIIALNTRQLR